MATLPDDTLAHAIKQVEAFGGRANVFVAFPDRMRLIEMHIGGPDDDRADASPAAPTTTMAMYVAFLESTERGHGVVTVRTSDELVSAPGVAEMAYAF
ncbi:hypothetical protein [Agrococcus sp. Marseille-Q4369]|uniref:hypothetical protein n=1 Tax=Agrococcus sp. Marseille-Q4369 TaxID=2810513 RepID=UPI001B8D3F01|nr:hypothetical protein [Agrococcus sp. Marseille-Q4369]QUW18908.1 hypothetical protein JSQ78_00540 [Agrococcus sp. Marseille-Q4369]